MKKILCLVLCAFLSACNSFSKIKKGTDSPEGDPTVTETGNPCLPDDPSCGEGGLTHVYSNAQIGLTLEYPADWSFEENLGGEEAIVVFRSPSETAPSSARFALRQPLPLRGLP